MPVIATPFTYTLTCGRYVGGVTGREAGWGGDMAGAMDLDVEAAPRVLRVAVVSEHTLARAGMVQGLSAQPDLEVVGEFDSCKDAVTAVVKSPPDVIVFELSLGGGHTLDAIDRCRKAAPAMAKVIVGDSRDPQLIRRLLAATALGYVFRRAGSSTLSEAIRYAVAGRVYVCPCIASILITPQNAPPQPTDLAPLTQREFVVFAMLGSSRTKAEIAADLGISVRTLDAHTEHLKAKLNIAHATELRAFARQRMQDGGLGMQPANITNPLPMSMPSLGCIITERRGRHSDGREIDDRHEAGAAVG